jgi:hypothetical protein
MKSITIGESDEYDDFTVDVPLLFYLEERINRCSMSLLSNPEESCNMPSTTAPSKLVLLSNSSGVCTYNDGSLSYHPQDIPCLCYEDTIHEAFKRE